MIDDETVRKIAGLARLSLQDQEVAIYGQQLSSILNTFNQLAKVPTEGVQPLVTPTEIQAHLRSDEVKPALSAQESLQNAPEKAGHLFKVPPVV